MDSQTIWQMFLDTGAPEMYLLYNKARKMEASNVLDNTRTCVKSHSIQ